ncbi:uncharacterized protein BXIN_1442 [Babesia sp. Xinjiang]|uniref:uncharacterized protein n=1 Tax=Babesia sp. Xinjiang TaxID=462227 RepID=UPI000A218B0E|nr:uncharacterized protein BXIN_1442 [Babesia sp. Xinjiang]ORM40109.1 hypothetical protein BXIN_1442 [Babesia sp. Xinjiang]
MSELTLGELKALKQREVSDNKPPIEESVKNLHKERSHLLKHSKAERSSQKSGPKKSNSKGPVVLPNNTACNPYNPLKFGKKGQSSRLIARDPRFSDFSGTLNDELFRKSYAFLDDMLQEEVKDIKSALRVGERAGAHSLKAAAALNNISHMNISSFSDAKRALDRYKTQQKQLKSDHDIRELKKDLISEEKKKIATTWKTPFYYSTKKVKKMLRAKEEAAIEAALQSSVINADGAGKIHKKVSRASKRSALRHKHVDVVTKKRRT